MHTTLPIVQLRNWDSDKACNIVEQRFKPGFSASNTSTFNCHTKLMYNFFLILASLREVYLAGPWVPQNAKKSETPLAECRGSHLYSKTHKADSGSLSGNQGQPELHSEFQATLAYRLRDPISKKQNKTQFLKKLKFLIQIEGQVVITSASANPNPRHFEFKFYSLPPRVWF